MDKSECDTAEEQISSKEESKENVINEDEKNLGENESEEKCLEIDSSGEEQNKSGSSSSSQQAPSRSNGGKRALFSASSETSAVPAKKVRNKPKPQIIENMKEYVDNNTAEKLTTATLRHWLKERSVHCTTRDKKADLIEKICKHLLTESS